MTNEEAIIRLEALRALSSEHSLKTIGKAIDMAIFALSSTAQPLAHIDREAWDPCGECAPNCSWCKHFQEISKTIPNVCRECNHYSNYEPEYNFCCECGRPLTEEAWAELEKRLRR